MSLLIVLSSPSGGGKTTVCNGLLQRDPAIRRAITCTIRSPREGEVGGRDYYFLSREEFERREKEGDFLETAIVHGCRYGSLRGEVEKLLAAGHDVLLAIDVQGAESIRRIAHNDKKLSRSFVDIFLMPASLDVLEQRLRKRGTESEDEIQHRLAVAREEINQAIHYQHIITSGGIEEDIANLQVIVEAERRKRAA